MILVFGSINIDLVARVNHIPKSGETVIASGYETHCGGKGANQAVAAARTAASHVAMVGCVGEDTFGELALANLAANDVSADHVARTKAPTGCAFIAVDGHGANAITVASGANGDVLASLVPDALCDMRTTIVLQMETPWRESLAVAQRIRARGGRVVWNVAPVVAGLSGSDVSAITAATDVLVLNEHESLMLAAASGKAAPDFRDAGASLGRSCQAGCVVTAGADGVFVVRADGIALHIAAPVITPVDTTGAGDTFVGILAAMLDEGRELCDAAAIACRGASLSCLAFGAQSAMPRRDALGL